MTADYNQAFADHRFDLLVNKGRLIGLVETVAQGDELMIVNIAVEPERQGKGHGVTLMRYSEEIARLTGLAGMRLYTNKLMTSNIAPYERLGYVFEKETTHDLGTVAVHMIKALEDAMADHFGLAQKEFGIEFEEIGDILGDHYEGLLFGCALEDLMTRRFEPDGINLVDDYLKRRGWNETAPAKAYMRSLRDSVCSLYELSDVIPGESFLARDMVRGGEPIRVSERTATRTLKQWDKISARIVPERRGHVLSGALLPFSAEGADTIRRIAQS
jgi:hypothetical protein